MMMRRLKLRYDASCCVCRTSLAAGTTAVWDGTVRTATCVSCADDPSAVAASGKAGASAAREAATRRERQAERRERDIAERPVRGRLKHAISPEPDAGRSWALGHAGERSLGAGLDSLAGDRLLVLHDRRLPRSKANIDHLVIAPSGVWVIDAKRHTGRVATVDKGGWLRSDVRLTVGGRDRTNLVAGVHRQVLHVEMAVFPEHGTDVAIRGVLCFVDSDWSLFAKPFTLDRVLVTWPRALGKRLLEDGSVDAARLLAIQRTLARALPPA